MCITFDRVVRCLTYNRLLLWVLICCASFAATAQENQGAVPEGFEELTGPQTAYLDVYYGGENVGGTIAIFTIDEIRFPEPGALIDLIPGIIDRPALVEVLSDAVPTNWREVCQPGQIVNCGRLQPEVVGVIFDSNRFRLDVFIAQNQLEIQRLDEVRYLPEATGELALTADLSTAFSGTEGRGPSDITSSTTADIIAGRGDIRAESMITYSDGRKTDVDFLSLVSERESLRSEGGFLRSRGSSLVSEVQFYGARFQTTTDLRVDLEISRATPIEFFFERRSRVEILRDGRLLSIDFYEPGNRQLNVARLPTGAYQITIRVFEGARLVREESRFFIKSSRFPPRDTILYTAEGGTLAAGSTSFDPRTLFPRGTEDWIVHGGLVTRLQDGLALGVDIYSTEDLTSFGTNVLFLAAGLNVEAALQAGDDNSWSALTQVNYGISTLVASLTARITRDGSYQPSSTNLVRGFFDPVREDRARVTGSLSWRKGPVRIGGRVEYLETGTGNSKVDQTSYLPSLTWQLFREGEQSADLSASANFTEGDWSATARLTLRQRAERWNFSADNVYAADRTRSEPFDSSSISASWQDDELFEDEITGSLILRNTKPHRRTLTARGNYIGGFAQANGTVEFENDNQFKKDVVIYSGRVRTGLAANAAGVSFTGRPKEGGAIVIDLAGDAMNMPFEVLVNNRVRATVDAGTTQPIFLEAYKLYQVRIRAKRPGNITFDAKTREVALYPGSVSVLTWDIDAIAPVFGRMVDEEGNPLSIVRIEAGDTQDFTDEFGYFVINISRADTTLSISRRGEPICTATLPEIDFSKELNSLGDVVCKSE